MLAHYIRFHLSWSRSTKLTVGAIAVAAGAVVTILSFYCQAIPGQLHETPRLEIGWSFCTLNVLVLTAGAFLLFSCIRQQRTPRLVAALSRLSFGMYLMHIFWLGMWTSVLKPLLPTVAAIPCIAIATFVSCAITTKLVSFLPKSKYLIG